MNETRHTALQWTAAALRQWLSGNRPIPASAGLGPEIRRFVEEQRLDNLASTWGLDGPGSLSGYARSALFQQRLLSEGTSLAARLESAGIPCLCLRGPFAAAALYPDPADRPFRDLDLLVPREHARRALRIFQEAGYRLHQPHMPAGYFLRNHLHWMLARAQDGIVCDLHWAVEHRFRPYQIDLDAIFAGSRRAEWRGMAWREPAPEHAFLLAALHARKHQPAVFDPLDASGMLFASGCLFQWLDLALVSRMPMDAARVARHAVEWKIEPVVGLAVRVLRDALGVDVPGPVAHLESFASASTRALPAWTSRLALPGLGRKACFRSSKVSDAVEFISRPHPSGRAIPTAIRRAGATFRVGTAVLDTLACAGLAGLRKHLHPGRKRTVSP